MENKKVFLKDMSNKTTFNTNLMIMKILHEDPEKLIVVLADRSADIKGTLKNNNDNLQIGNVISAKCKKDSTLLVEEYSLVNEFMIEDYLPTSKRSIDEIMSEIDKITNEYILSDEARALNDYFFKDLEFVNEFSKAIGGVSMHHNYIGGLAEHTLNVMHITSILCEKYKCRHTEIAVLCAKLHDIGKIHELIYDGPFRYSLRGHLEGHIVIGLGMINEVFNTQPVDFSDDFIARVRGCIVQHHGKVEYGSPRDSNMEESFIINFADTVDATMSRIVQIKDVSQINEWSNYDKKLDTKLYL